MGNKKKEKSFTVREEQEEAVNLFYLHALQCDPTGGNFSVPVDNSQWGGPKIYISNQRPPLFFRLPAEEA